MKNEVKKRCLKAGHAAEYLDMSRRGLYDLTASGKLPHIKVGPRCLLYDLSDLDAFLDARKVG